MFLFLFSIILSCHTILPSTTSERPVEPKIWALLVAGSDGYSNYRHQADVCHAYHILINNGIPTENIIVMMADDIANSPENPTPGIIINQPYGADVYKGVAKDYTKNDVTPKNFLNILSGNKNAMTDIGSGRVIESGPSDYVFVNFVDHGGPGILGFPNNELHVIDLIPVLKQMATDKKFLEMVLYVEACYSGSMFDIVLEDNLNIFVMTASDVKESSYACYYDAERQTFLGDVFSVNWMREAEQEPLPKSSLNHLFKKVRSNTITSHVEEYGDLDIGNTIISKIIGALKTKNKNEYNIPFKDPNADAVPQTDVWMVILHKKLEKAKQMNDTNKVKKLKKMIRVAENKRSSHLETMNRISLTLSEGDKTKAYGLENPDVKIDYQSMDCYKTVVDEYSNKCFNIAQNEFVLPSLKYFANACAASWTNTDAILNAVRFSCKNKILNSVRSSFKNNIIH